MDRLTQDLVRRVAALERRLDDLVKPEVGGWRFIAESVLSSSAASITFSSIPGIYRTLALWMHSRTDHADKYGYVLGRFNGDGASNYDRFIKTTSGTGSVLYLAARATSSMYVAHCEGANARTGAYTVSVTYIPGYSLTNCEKWLFTLGSGRWGDRSTDGDLYLAELKSAWRSTAQVTSVALFPQYGSNLVAGCRFALYGIL